MRDLDDYQVQYDDYPFENILLKYRKKKIIEFLNFYKPNKILEIGCGYDPLFTHFNDFDELCIVEPSKKFFENALKKAKMHDTNGKVSVRNTLFENDLDYLRSRKFEFVVLAGLLHEVESPNNMLNSVHKIINNDTVVHINVPNANSLHRIVALHAGKINSVHELSDYNIRFQQSTVFDIKRLERLLLLENFLIIDYGTLFIKPFAHSQMQRLVDNSILDKTMLDGLYKATNSLKDLGCELYANVKVK